MNKQFLSNCIHSKDLLNDDCVAGSYDAEELAQRATTVVQYGFTTLKLEPVLIKRKVAYRVRSTPHSVVLRGLNRLIRQATKIRPSDRDTIIRRLGTVLAEGVPHRIYKFDIKAFFESVDTKRLFDELANVSTLPRSAALVLEHYLNELHSRGIIGLPRGVQLSATLSEFTLQRFDGELSILPEVYFHARYVDDIVIVTSGRENPKDFARKIRRLLAPLGLELNHKKTKRIEIPVQSKSDGRATLGQFDYLGYNFSIHESTRNAERRLAREVEITIAGTKIARLKTRLCCSIGAFLDDGDIGKLERRLQVLTGNYNVRDFSIGRSRNTGLYCNYRRVNSQAALAELDTFFRSLLIGTRNRLSRRLATKAPAKVRRSLLKYNFVQSFNQRTFYNFPMTELGELRRCWRDG
ncbi:MULTISPECIES: antiviral reverse transcriptase Drt3a [Bradyrhizobium]|uniref:Reverse transcriptase (RNA-dependent DNA polymerase) n=2 Tax=Bradyrhizobium TaxID=374 RepID=A0ABY0PK03_9BRAD|nr:MULTISPECIES: antiviral reverse transcriptase Drt3a [Bradyrhizobium]SDI54980.1 Reverse transcriptase (RNA-dependent DNA polymerase) [Bradyrhizobium ottawaense]SED42439.1 Reverse transcriptase (RNA-dependent DNA polymerase) [Bradyrhizobium lablabi]